MNLAKSLTKRNKCHNRHVAHNIPQFNIANFNSLDLNLPHFYHMQSAYVSH